MVISAMLFSADYIAVGAPQNGKLKGNQKDNLDATTYSSTEYQGQLDSKVNNIWDLFHRRGGRTEALAEIDAEIGRYPERIYLHAWKGRMLAEIYESEPAMKEIDLVLRKLPNDSHALAIKARILAQLSRTEEACREANKAFAIAPDNIYVLGTTLRVLKDAGRFAEALKPADLLVKLNPSNNIILSDRAFCLSEVGGRANLEKAVIDLTKVVKNTGAQTIGFKNDIRLSVIHFRLGNAKQAETVLIECCNRYPNAPQPLLELIKLYERLGQKEKALARKKKLDILQNELGI